jgi:hypothetical protein
VEVLSDMRIAPFTGLASARRSQPRAILNATLTGFIRCREMRRASAARS